MFLCHQIVISEFRYSKYSGKLDKFRYQGPHLETREMAIKRTVVVMDAKNYSHDTSLQFEQK